MATNPIGKGKAVVSAVVPKHIADEIKARADRLHWSVSQYASELLGRWYREGALPVHPFDSSELDRSLVAESAGSVIPPKHNLAQAAAEENRHIARELARAQREKDKQARAAHATPPPVPAKSSAKARESS